METIFAFVVGVIFTAAVFLILRRNIFRVIMGLALLSQGANLLIFTCGGLTRAKSPIINKMTGELVPPFADPLPQALILTAIVISFGVLSYALVLLYKAWQTIDVSDIDHLKSEVE